MPMNEVNKIILSPFDNKRFYQSDGIFSLAFGHYKTGQIRPQKFAQKEITLQKK